MRPPLAPITALAVTGAVLAGSLASQVAAAPSAPAVRVGAPCPPREPSVSPTSWSAAKTVLAPKGATAALLCRYSGLNDHPPRALVRSVKVTSAHELDRLIREFDALPHFPTPTPFCPADFGTEIVVGLAYPGSHALALSVETSGCNTVANGDITRFGAGSALVRDLTALTR